MIDPFLITGPAVVSFSGGRTSAFMLWRILQAHGGVLPDDVVVCFANTGREMPATLDFVRDCGAAWDVPVVWLEYRHKHVAGRARRVRWAEVVNHNSASREGEPFDLLLQSKGIVPDPFRRFCTEELKVRTVERHLRTLGWSAWSNVVGLRADESVRVDRKRAKEAARPGRFRTLMPLADGGVEVLDVMRFWRAQPFDLQMVSKDGGNCDGCFMKSSEMLARMFRAHPERMQWWVDKERAGCGKTFVAGRSYERIQQLAHAQYVLPWDDGSDCDQGCGT